MKRKIGLFVAAMLLPFTMTDTVGAASLDKPLPSNKKVPVKVERKGDFIYKWYDGASPVKIPSEKEIAKRHGKLTVQTAQSTFSMLSGYRYDNTDPVATGCSTDAFTAKSAILERASDRVVVGTVELRYSPSCRTAWGRIHVIDDDAINYGLVELYRTENGTANFKTMSYASPGDSNYTNQFYDGGVTSFARGKIVGRNGYVTENVTDPY